MKVVYVAGPFRGPNAWEIEQNIRRAEALALEVWRAGFACICPHTNTRFFQGAADDDIWLSGDLELIRRCDALLMTPDWEQSTGARAEQRLARELGMPVFYSVDELRRATVFGRLLTRQQAAAAARAKADTLGDLTAHGLRVLAQEWEQHP